MASNDDRSCCSGDTQKQIMNAEQVKQYVSEYYAALLENEGCCGSSKSCCSEDSKHAVAKGIGYTSAELADMPSDAAEHSFGCGTPLAHADVKAGEIVLDLGSGAGIDVFVASRMVGAEGKVIGLDMTQEMLDRARKNAAEADIHNVEFRLGEMEDMPVDSGSVDLVISNCVINLSSDKGKVFSEAFRVLKPGGRMAVSDVVADGLSDSMRANPTIWACCIGGAMAENDYLQAFRDAGFKDVKVLDKVEYDAEILKQFGDCCPSDSGQAGTDIKLASITVSATKV